MSRIDWIIPVTACLKVAYPSISIDLKKKIVCMAHPSPIGMYTNPSRDRDNSTLPALLPTLINYKLDQMLDGSP